VESRLGRFTVGKGRRIPFLKSEGEALATQCVAIPSICSYEESCGGCSYLGIKYEDELRIKSQLLRSLFENEHAPWGALVKETVPSPAEWNHRSKMTLQVRRYVDGKIVCGNSPYGKKSVLEIDSCQVARPELSDAISRVRHEVPHKKMSKYGRACVVMRSDGKHMAWGGIGKGSLRQSLGEGFVFVHDDVQIHYSLLSFFQSNLSMLPLLLKRLGDVLDLGDEDIFYDLYGGVGLFALTLGRSAKKALLIELNPDAIEWAKLNVQCNGFNHIDVVESSVEAALSEIKEYSAVKGRHVGVIDPPRAGLHEDVCRFIQSSQHMNELLYLSCNPETQVRDIARICKNGSWSLEWVEPWDFFPKSYHIESLALLRRIM
jgi:tRNA/tmRNA/rRNA uracil-C5-methylase (TrmA/RlmC/RlmD family)